MENIILELFKSLVNTKTMIIICVLVISVDTLTGLIKAFYLKKYNSSINRKGIASKMMWFVLLALGVLIDMLVNFNGLLLLIVLSCVFSEIMSIFENAKECGLDFKMGKYLNKQ